MDMRDKITEILDEYSVHTDRSLDDVSDAILAALPDMIPDLVWAHPSSANFKKGECFHSRGVSSHYAVHMHSNGWWLNIDSKTYPTIEDAKSAANAHHRAQLAKAMGWTV